MSDAVLGPLFGDHVVEDLVSDRALIRAMLTAESALALSCADAGLVAAEAAAQVAAACAALEPDLPAIAKGAAGTGNPVVPLLAQLRERLPEAAHSAVHFGATSQDVVDTALMLVTRDATRRILSLAERAAEAAAAAAHEHRTTVMVARTLGQQAQPTTFGLVAAGWLAQLDTATRRLSAVLDTGLAVQLGGAVGTLAAYGEQGLAVGASLAERIGLAPALPWHTDRQRVLDIAHAMAGLVAAAGKAATDVILLASSEIAEVRLAGGGGSSAMPHKENPVSAVLIRAAATRTPGLVATLVTAAVHDQQRATGAWHAEWPAWRELLQVSGGAAARLVELFEQLEVAPDRMRANLDATGGLLMGESLTHQLQPLLGPGRTREVLAGLARTAAAAGSYEAAARQDETVTEHLSSQDIAAAFEPTSWLGSAHAIIDAALANHRERLA